MSKGTSRDDGASRAVTVLVAALGGEGGGVLTSWLVNAAQAADLPVQATSIPGVAQRTGATTYYLEVWPQPWSALDGRAPLLALSPAPGEVDVMAASELMEAGRAVKSGLVTPERTLLIASTHRIYATVEKMQMGDGRFDADALLEAARSRSQANILADFRDMARQAGAPLNAVLLGLLAGCGRLPIPEDAFRQGIQAEGKAAEANLRGFEAGLAAARAGLAESEAEATPAPAGNPVGPLLDRARTELPSAVHETVDVALRRLADYQDPAYARLYLDRLCALRRAPVPVLESLARHLAVRMSYEDAIRVAQVKTRPGRLARLRAEVGAGPDEPVVVTEFLKPGLQEIADILPVPLAALLLAIGRRWPRLASMRRGMHVRSSGLWGHAQLRLLAAMRHLRRFSWRYDEEQEAIEDWLEWTGQALELDAALAREIVECARLIKGYGSTHERGRHNFARIVDTVVRPALAREMRPARAAQTIAKARAAALADPEGSALDAVLGAPPEPSEPSSAA